MNFREILQSDERIVQFSDRQLIVLFSEEETENQIWRNGLMVFLDLTKTEFDIVVEAIKDAKVAGVRATKVANEWSTE